MHVIVAGAGIGGLTAALSLHAAGIDALVIDAAVSLRPLGRTVAVAGTNAELKFVAYPISRQAEARGHALLNWVAEVKLPRADSATSGASSRRSG